MADIDAVMKVEGSGVWPGYNGHTGARSRVEHFRDRDYERANAVAEPGIQEKLRLLPQWLWDRVVILYQPGEGNKPQLDNTNEYGVRITKRPFFHGTDVINIYHVITTEEAQARVTELTYARRAIRWDECRYIAAHYCAALAVGKDADQAASGWGMAPSTAKMWASLARIFPPDCEDPALSQKWYWTLGQIAKMEVGILRPATKPAWDTVSKQAVALFYTHWKGPNALKSSVDDLKHIYDAMKAQTEQPLGSAEYDENTGELKRYRVRLHADEKHKPHPREEDGKLGKVMTLPKLLAANGIANQDFELILVPLNAGIGAQPIYHQDSPFYEEGEA